MELIFATQNNNKTREIEQILGGDIKLINLRTLGLQEDIPENEHTLEGNAGAKVRYVYERFGKPCFADDTGLEVDVLGGAPGVYSARFAGPEKDSSANMYKLLGQMQYITKREAQFRTVISLIINNIELLFEGTVRGTIANEPRGEQGFGYDPVFVPEGYEQTFAEISPEEKNRISHRAIAVNKFADYVKNLRHKL